MVQVEGGTVPKELPGPPVPSCRTARCYCSQSASMGPFRMLTAPLVQLAIQWFIFLPLCVSSGHRQGLPNTLTSDFPLLLSSPCKQPPD